MKKFLLFFFIIFIPLISQSSEDDHLAAIEVLEEGYPLTNDQLEIANFLRSVVGDGLQYESHGKNYTLKISEGRSTVLEVADDVDDIQGSINMVSLQWEMMAQDEDYDFNWRSFGSALKKYLIKTAKEKNIEIPEQWNENYQRSSSSFIAVGHRPKKGTQSFKKGVFNTLAGGDQAINISGSTNKLSAPKKPGVAILGTLGLAAAAGMIYAGLSWWQKRKINNALQAHGLRNVKLNTKEKDLLAVAVSYKSSQYKKRLMKNIVLKAEEGEPIRYHKLIPVLANLFYSIKYNSSTASTLNEQMQNILQ